MNTSKLPSTAVTNNSYTIIRSFLNFQISYKHGEFGKSVISQARKEVYYYTKVGKFT